MLNRFARIAIVVGLISLYFVTTSPAHAAPMLRGRTWLADDDVLASAVVGNTAYIGGKFTTIGPDTGHFALLNVSDGMADNTLPRVNGQVYAILPDGMGGWFIEGKVES